MLIKSLHEIPTLPAVTSGLLPAVHNASVLTTAPTNAVDQKGRVFRNASTGDITLPAALGRPAATVAAGDYFACDGRLYYPVEKLDGTNSYYPLEFTRELFSVFLAEEMVPQLSTVRLSFDLGMRSFSSNTMAQWVVVLQIGQRSSDITPAPVGANLSGFAWLAPSVSHAITFGSVAQQHSVGLQIQRLADVSGVAGFRASSLSFGSMAACQAPTANGFVIRAKLAQFDTENNVSSPSGFVAYEMLNGKMEISK
jgi:hypothetical protein